MEEVVKNEEKKRIRKEKRNTHKKKKCGHLFINNNISIYDTFAVLFYLDYYLFFSLRARSFSPHHTTTTTHIHVYLLFIKWGVERERKATTITSTKTKGLLNDLRRSAIFFFNF